MKANKAIYRILFLVSCGMIIFIISLIKECLIRYDLYTLSGKIILAVALFIVIYLNYRWFGARINAQEKSQPQK